MTVTVRPRSHLRFGEWTSPTHESYSGSGPRPCMWTVDLTLGASAEAGTARANPTVTATAIQVSERFIQRNLPRHAPARKECRARLCSDDLSWKGKSHKAGSCRPTLDPPLGSRLIG